MPTQAIQPSFEKTKAVGAALLHQFVKEGMEQARVEKAENFLKEAEEKENLNNLVAVLLEEENLNDTRETGGDSADTTINSSTLTCVNETNRSWPSVSTSTATLRSNSILNNTTLNSDRFVSIIADQSTLQNDVTNYHSMNEDQSQQQEQVSTQSAPVDDVFDRVQRLPIMVEYGRMLRDIAEEFEQDRLRKMLKKRAEEINFKELQEAKFSDLLKELFDHGVSRSKIVILFIFCSDVAVRAASVLPELVVELLQWSFSYIIKKFCKFVYNLGGWSVALSSERWDDILFRQLPSALVSCCAILGILSIMGYLHRSSKVCD